MWHQYTVRVTDDAPLGREALVERLHAEGIGAGVYYPRLAWDYACFADHPRVVADPTPFALTAARQVVSLPVHARLTDSNIDEIVAKVRAVMHA